MYEEKYDYDFLIERPGVIMGFSITGNNTAESYADFLICGAEEILRQNPRNVSAMYEKAKGLFILKKFDESITVCNEMLQSNENNVKTEFAGLLKTAAMGSKRYLEKHPEEKQSTAQ